MSQKPNIIFNPDFNKLVLDPSKNRLVTKGELAKKTETAIITPKPPPIVPAVAPVIANKTVNQSIWGTKPTITKPNEPAKPVLTTKPTITKPNEPAKPVLATKPTVTKPAEPAKPVLATKPTVTKSAEPAKPVLATKPTVTKPAEPAKSVIKKDVKEVKFDISASLDVPKQNIFNKGQLVIPFRGGYGAVILGRGRR